MYHHYFVLQLIAFQCIKIQNLDRVMGSLGRHRAVIMQRIPSRKSHKVIIGPIHLTKLYLICNLVKLEVTRQSSRKSYLIIIDISFFDQKLN